MTMNKEEWRDIAGYEGKYQVSNLGNVKSLNYNRTGKEKLMTPSVDSYGYLVIGLRKNGKKKQYRVHRLVAEAFIPDKVNFKYVNEEDRLKYIDNLDKLQINHKDEHPKNNCVDNLEWCTHWYNDIYGTRIERIAKARTNDPRISKKILQYDLDGNFIREWPSAKEIERELGYFTNYICKCCLGKYKTAYGYIWRYKEE